MKGALPKITLAILESFCKVSKLSKDELEKLISSQKHRWDAIDLLLLDSDGLLPLIQAPYDETLSGFRLKDEDVGRIILNGIGRFPNINVPLVHIMNNATVGFLSNRKEAIKILSEIGDKEGVDALFRLEHKRLGSDIFPCRILRTIKSLLEHFGYQPNIEIFPYEIDYYSTFAKMMAITTLEKGMIKKILYNLWTSDLRNIISILKVIDNRTDDQKEKEGEDGILASDNKRRKLTNEDRTKRKEDEPLPRETFDVAKQKLNEIIGQKKTTVDVAKQKLNEIIGRKKEKNVEGRNDLTTSSTGSVSSDLSARILSILNRRSDTEILKAFKQLFVIKIPEPAEGFDPMISLEKLKTDNPSLDTSSWELEAARLDWFSQKLTVSVDNNSAIAISELWYRARYGGCIAEFERVVQ